MSLHAYMHAGAGVITAIVVVNVSDSGGSFHISACRYAGGGHVSVCMYAGTGVIAIVVDASSVCVCV